MLRRPPRSPLFPYTTPFRSLAAVAALASLLRGGRYIHPAAVDEVPLPAAGKPPHAAAPPARRDRKSTRLNSSHLVISYAVFCLKKNSFKFNTFIYLFF